MHCHLFLKPNWLQWNYILKMGNHVYSLLWDESCRSGFVFKYWNFSMHQVCTWVLPNAIVGQGPTQGVQSCWDSPASLWFNTSPMCHQSAVPIDFSGKYCELTMFLNLLKRTSAFLFYFSPKWITLHFPPCSAPHLPTIYSPNLYIFPWKPFASSSLFTFPLQVILV